MARDPLQVLLRLRGMELDAARRALAEQLRAQTAAEARCAGIGAAVAHETTVQRSQAGAALTADTYAAWLHRAQTAQKEARRAADASVTATAAARESVNAANAAAQALEAALEHVTTTRRAAAAREEQTIIDEAGASGWRRGRWSG